MPTCRTLQPPVPLRAARFHGGTTAVCWGAGMRGEQQRAGARAGSAERQASFSMVMERKDRDTRLVLCNDAVHRVAGRQLQEVAPLLSEGVELEADPVFVVFALCLLLYHACLHSPCRHRSYTSASGEMIPPRARALGENRCCPRTRATRSGAHPSIVRCLRHNHSAGRREAGSPRPSALPLLDSITGHTRARAYTWNTCRLGQRDLLLLLLLLASFQLLGRGRPHR